MGNEVQIRVEQRDVPVLQGICPFCMIEVITFEDFLVPLNSEGVIGGHHFLQQLCVNTSTRTSIQRLTNLKIRRRMLQDPGPGLVCGHISNTSVIDYLRFSKRDQFAVSMRRVQLVVWCVCPISPDVLTTLPSHNGLSGTR